MRGAQKLEVPGEVQSNKRENYERLHEILSLSH
jgi:hypothetical protein